MNKKSFLLDFFYIIVILLVTGVCIYVAYIISHNTALDELFSTDATATFANSQNKKTVATWDNLVLFMLVGASLFVVLSAGLVFNHPAMFIISIFVVAIAIVVSAIIANTFSDLSASPSMVEAAAAFPKLNYIMNNLPLYILFLSAAASAAMFVGYRQNG